MAELRDSRNPERDKDRAPDRDHTMRLGRSNIKVRRTPQILSNRNPRDLSLHVL